MYFFFFLFRAQLLIEAVRREKAEAERAEEQRKEIERREAMKNLQKIRRDMENQEMKDLVAKKNKEREEEKRFVFTSNFLNVLIR